MEEIIKLARAKDEAGWSNERIKKFVRKQFHARDESHLYPIRNKFNATHRAICRANRYDREVGGSGWLEYIYGIDQELSNIVNDESNW